MRERITQWLARFRSEPPFEIKHNNLPFAVGDRVRDTWGNKHTVVRIEPKADHGKGVIRTRRDDGTELSHMMFAHGLTHASKENRTMTAPVPSETAIHKTKGRNIRHSRAPTSA